MRCTFRRAATWIQSLAIGVRHLAATRIARQQIVSISGDLYRSPEQSGKPGAGARQALYADCSLPKNARTAAGAGDAVNPVAGGLEAGLSHVQCFSSTSPGDGFCTADGLGAGEGIVCGKLWNLSRIQIQPVSTETIPSN